MAILSIISAAMAVLMTKEPKVVFEQQAIVLNKPSFFHRLRAIPILFLRVPHLNDFKSIFRGLKYELTRDVPILYFSIFLFYLGTGVFNTSIIPSLEANNVSNFLIFLVITVVMIVQILSFRYAGPYTEKKSPVTASTYSLVLRA
ncbi:MAG TPA: hypothetical protein VK209_08190 [Candidatus Sulfotelmatobacter sp.]|nr:hypothetical protein [Candidatus Sulfotelmatobacter sp.]